jgi:hypothetical protein
MACALTQGNTIGCGEGFGGIRTIYLGNADDFTLTYTTGVVTTITKATGKRFWKYDLVPFTAEAKFTGSNTRENATQEVKQTITLVINKLTAGLRAELGVLSGAIIKAVVIDNNGEAFMYGQDFGLNVPTIEGGTGKALKDRNGVTITLEGMEKLSPPSVNSTLVAALETPG